MGRKHTRLMGKVYTFMLANKSELSMKGKLLYKALTDRILQQYFA